MIKRVKSSSENLENREDDPNYWNLEYLRNSRNAYLLLTDKYFLPDFPISPEKLEIIKNYREYLRNFININKEAILRGDVVDDIQPIPEI